MKNVQRMLLLVLALVMLSAPAASAISASSAPFLLPPQEGAEDAYQRYRTLCEEHGFELLPDEEAFPEYADDGSDLVVMMRVPVDVAEWGLIYPSVVNYIIGIDMIGYSLCVHKGAPAFDRVDELMTMYLSTLFDMNPEAAQARVGEVLEDMESAQGSQDGLGYIIMDGVRLIVSEDDVRRVLILIEEPSY